MQRRTVSAAQPSSVSNRPREMQAGHRERQAAQLPAPPLAQCLASPQARPGSAPTARVTATTDEVPPRPQSFSDPNWLPIIFSLSLSCACPGSYLSLLFVAFQYTGMKRNLLKWMESIKACQSLCLPCGTLSELSSLVLVQFLAEKHSGNLWKMKAML